MEERAEQFGQRAERRDWRLVTMMHIAETKEQAYKDVEFGLADYATYFREVAALPIFPDVAPSELADHLNHMGGAVIGTPEDAIALIDELIQESNGGFGTILLQAHEWANPEATRRSYELFAQYVLPAFDSRSLRTEESMNWVMANRTEQMGAAMNAIGAAMQEHAAEKSAGKSAEGHAAPAAG
jgi:limonene 1,2-monooxygenase